MKRILLLFFFIDSSLPLVAEMAGNSRSILKATIDHTSIVDSSLEDALRLVQLPLAKRHMLITLELRENDKAKDITLRGDGMTVKAILDNVMRQHKGYQFVTFGHSVIHVFPASSSKTRKSLLNLKLSKVILQKVPYDLLIRYPARYLPELNQKAKNGPQVGSLMGAAVSPEINLELEQPTVREVLNAATQQASESRITVSAGWLYDPSKNNPWSTLSEVPERSD
jgi:hypothetical protein